MKKTLLAVFLILSLVFVISCRNQPEFLNYSAYFDSNTNPEGTDRATTWKELFSIYWHKMNSNYVFWDLDDRSGTYWDEVYDKYMPEFEKLGDIYAQGEDARDVSKYALAALTVNEDSYYKAEDYFFEITKPLSDGHYGLDLTIGAKTEGEGETQTTTVFGRYFQPFYYRLISNLYDENGNKLFTDEETIKKHILKRENSTEIEKALSEAETESTDGIIYYTFLKGAENNGVLTVNDEGAFTWDDSMKNKYSKPENSTMGYFWFNKPKTDTSAEANIKGALGTIPVDSTDSSKGNYVYFSFDGFAFTSFASQDATGQWNYIDGAAEMGTLLDDYGKLLRDENTKGVIIDLRWNGGGNTNDLSLIWQPFMNGETIKIGEFRRKLGDNRTDYGPWTPYVIGVKETPTGSTFNKEIPIALLINRRSFSCSEVSTLFFQALKSHGYKVRIIGEQSGGGFGALSSDLTAENLFNAGTAIVAQMTQLYTPFQEVRDLNGVNHEGKGFPVDGEEILFKYSKFTNPTSTDYSSDEKLSAALTWLASQQ